MASLQINLGYLGFWKTIKIKANLAHEQVMLNSLSWRLEEQGLKRSAGI